MADPTSVLPDSWTIEPRADDFISRLREVWRYRRMLAFFASRSLLKLYKNTVLGGAWIFLRPLIPLTVNMLVFGALLDVGRRTRVPYFLFLAVGTTAWELFAQTVMWATRSLELNGGVLTRVYVPRLILPVATMTPGIVYFLINVGVIAGTLVYYRVSQGVWYLDSSWLVAAPAAVVLILLFALSIGLFTSVLAIGARDVRFGLGYALEFWIYLTPVVYPLTIVPGHVQWLLMLNPMAVLVVAFRGAIIGGEGPTTWAWASAIAIIAVILAAGLAYFHKAEAEALDSL